MDTLQVATLTYASVRRRLVMLVACRRFEDAGDVDYVAAFIKDWVNRFVKANP
jgi:hypothetical protein